MFQTKRRDLFSSMTTLSMFNLSYLKVYSNSIRMTAITTNSVSSDTVTSVDGSIFTVYVCNI